MIVQIATLGRTGAKGCVPGRKGRCLSGRAQSGCIAVLFAVCSLACPSARAQVVVSQKSAVAQLAKDRGILVTTTDADGRTYSLQKFVNGIPLYYKTFNAVAAKSVKTNLVHPDGGGGLSLTGLGVRLGIWDGGAVRTSHTEFTGRASQRDFVTTLNFHATHVAGTMIAAGINASAKGMAFQAQLDCHDWDFDLNEMLTAYQSRGVRISNHSYGLITGWEQFLIFEPGGPEEPRGGPIPVAVWVWFGDVSVNDFEDHYFGYYSDEARAWDVFSHANPRYLWVKAAGNDRNQGPAPGTGHYYFHPVSGELEYSTATRSKDGNNGYDSVSHSATGKNGLVVGAVNDVPAGYSSPASVTMSTFSCWGPTDDGRIKPDVVGNGVQLFSCLELNNSDYGSLSGTSMASPNVSGSLGLLQQHWAMTHSTEPEMLSSTMKGLAIHTADECGGAPGPDYQFGWGLLNTQRAADVISADVNMPLLISEQTLGEGEELLWYVISDASHSEVRATICWTDPPGTVPSPALDDPTPILVNDLDVRLDGTSQVHMPWVLNPVQPGAAATRGDNVVDNVEQVLVNKTGEQAYRLRITHKGSLQGGSQVFSMILTGVSQITTEVEQTPPSVVATVPAAGGKIGSLPSVAVTFSEPVSGVTASQLTVNGVPATGVTGNGSGPYTFTGFSAPADGIVRVQLAGGQKDIFENVAAGLDWDYTKADCNNNGVFDPTDVETGAAADCNGNQIPDSCDPAALHINAAEEQVMPFGQLMHLNGASLVSGGTPPYTFEWTLRGNNGEENSTEETPAFQPKQPGVYVARLVVTDALGCRVIGYITVEVSQSDLNNGPIPLGPITLGGAMCPFGGILPLSAVLCTLMFCRRVRAVRRRLPNR